MKKLFPNLNLFPAFLFFFIFQNVLAQDFSYVDSKIKSYPATFSNTEKLATMINNDFSSDADKARAIYTWIASNVKYELNAARSGQTVAFYYSDEQDRIEKEKTYRRQLAQKTITSHKGVCQNYAALFHDLCDQTGLKCIDIPGMAKTNPAQIGKLPEKNDHVWNAVRIGNSWNLVDVTWGSGSVDTDTGRFEQAFNDGYFCTMPEIFFLNHFPEDKRLMMIDRTEQDFADLPLYYGEYIQSDCEIIAPETGILNAGNNLVPFKIRDLNENDHVSYIFSSEARPQHPEIRRNGNISEFEINLGAQNRGYLTLFINNKSIAAYKISR